MLTRRSRACGAAGRLFLRGASADSGPKQKSQCLTPLLCGDAPMYLRVEEHAQIPFLGPAHDASAAQLGRRSLVLPRAGGHASVGLRGQRGWKTRSLHRGATGAPPARQLAMRTVRVCCGLFKKDF